MTVEKPSAKSLRMQAIDTDGHIKVFLVMSRPDDINQLFKHLTERVRRAKDTKPTPATSKMSTVTTETTAVDNNDLVDEISPVKVRIIDTSTNNETGEPEANNAVPLGGTNTTSTVANDSSQESLSSLASIPSSEDITESTEQS